MAAQNNERFRSLVEQAFDGITLSDEDGIIIEWNAGMEKITGIRREEAIGRLAYDIIVLASADNNYGSYNDLRSKTEKGLQTGESNFFNRTMDVVIKNRKSGERVWVQQTVFPIKTGKGYRIGSFIRNVSEERRREELDRALNSINKEMVSTLEADRVIDAAISIARSAVGCDAVLLNTLEDDKWVMKYGSGVPPGVIGVAIDAARDGAYSNITSGKPVISNDAMSDSRLDPNVIKRFGIKAEMVMPIEIGGKLLGVLAFAYSSRTHEFTTPEIDFATKLSTTMSLILENVRLYEMEKEGRDLTQMVIDFAPANIVLVDGETSRIKLENGSFRKSVAWFTGGKDLKGTSIFDVFPTMEKELKAAFKRIKENGEPSRLDEFGYDIPGLGMTYWNNVAIPVPQKNAVPDAMIMSVDVTDLVNGKKRIQELAERAEREHQRIRAILATIPAGVIICDSKGRVIESNQIMDKILGGRFPKIDGPSDYRVFKGWYADSGIPLRAEDWGTLKAIRNGEPVIDEVIDLERSDGSRGTIITSAAPIRDANGSISGAVAVINDITQERKLEHEALEVKRRAELYLDLLTHDIRNMNAAASSFLQAIGEKGRLERASQGLMARAIESLESSIRLTDNIRKVQRLEFHEMKYGPVDLGKTLDEVLETYLHIPDRNIVINFTRPIGYLVIANEYLMDVFLNIIGNSIQHSEDPLAISIIVTTAYESGREYYKIIIEDNGPGIPDDMKKKLFSQPVRGKKKVDGKGLGLYLVSRIVSDFHGRVWVEDRVPGDHSKGAKFVVVLPVVSK